MTADQLSIARADILYKTMAATGFLIGAFDDLEDLNGGKTPFARSLKYAAKKFNEELLKAETVITSQSIISKEESADQLFDSYRLMNHLLSVALLAQRTLTPAGYDLLQNELEEVSRKWGVFPK